MAAIGSVQLRRGRLQGNYVPWKSRRWIRHDKNFHKGNGFVQCGFEPSALFLQSNQRIDRVCWCPHWRDYWRRDGICLGLSARNCMTHAARTTLAAVFAVAPATRSVGHRIAARNLVMPPTIRAQLGSFRMFLTPPSQHTGQLLIFHFGQQPIRTVAS